jgi:HEAT repeat protein
MDLRAWRRRWQEDPQGAEAQLSALREDPEVLETWIEDLLRDPDPEARAWACRLSVELPDARGEEALLRALEDPEPEVRAAAAWALGARPREAEAPRIAQALCARLHDLPWVAWVAAEALARYGEAALDPLIEGLRHPNPQVRILAARALARIASPRSLPALMAAREDSVLLVRHFAEAGLDRLFPTQWVRISG